MQGEFSADFVPYKIWFSLTRIERDKVCKLPPNVGGFFPGIPASSTSKTDRRDYWNIVENGVKPHANKKKYINKKIRG